VGLELVEPGIARSGYGLYQNDCAVGRVTSGTMSPTLGKSIALGYVSREAAEAGENVHVEIRGRKTRAKIVSLPFVGR
jgi:aminomethyltransferase